MCRPVPDNERVMPRGKLESIFIAPTSAAPMEPRKQATLIPGVGIEGDRYALQTGTYSAKFIGEPGKNLTLVSADAVEKTMVEKGMEPFESMGALRRNVVVRGLSAEQINDMVGHEIQVGNCRLFVHRRTVPCKYREAQCKRPGLMNNLWDVCGVNCQILTGGTLSVGDPVDVIPATYQPKRADPGYKPPAFFTKPSERSAEEARSMIIPPMVAAIMCLIDPVGFQRVEDGYNSAGQQFWSPKAYQAGMCAKQLRAPLLATVAVVSVAVVVGVARKALR